jgi:glycyl-tRNA synthetase
MAPSGARDPFAQRRAALGLVQALIFQDMSFNLKLGLGAAAALLPIPMQDEASANCLGFIIERLRNFLLDSGWRYDVVDAVIAVHGSDPARAHRSVEQLSAWVSRPDWHSILPAYARCVRITRDQAQEFPLDPNAFAHPAEEVLHSSLLQAEATLRDVR